MEKKSSILITSEAPDYALLDSGDGERLERFGKYILSRPDPQTLWRKRLSPQEWKNADGHFTRDDKNGGWSLKKDIPERWQIDFSGLKFWIRPTTFKHTGLFPEQTTNWDWLRGVIAPYKGGTPSGSEDGGISRAPEILNLFGYTGGATLVCAEAGASVVHVDGSKVALTWARENAELSGLEKKPIRWILDDARAFVKREIKRGRKYHGIIMDPPAFGHGPENELWKIEEHFLPLIEACFSILADKPLFFLINGYSAGYSAIAYENVLMPLIKKYGGKIEIGELTIEESKAVGHKSRLLPCGIFARWEGK